MPPPTLVTQVMTEKEARSFHLFAFWLLLFIFLPSAIVSGIIVLIDPYWLYGAPSRPWLNASHIVYERHVGEAKPYQVVRIRPNTVFLGSSRAEAGLNPSHPALAPGRTFNFGLPGANSYEVMSAFLHAQRAGGPLTRTVIGLDFFAYNIFRRNKSETDERRFLGNGTDEFADFLDAELPKRTPVGKRADTSPPPAPAPGWNEAGYLAANPAVRIALARGQYRSGFEHYVAVGRDRGLLGGYPAGDTAERLRLQWPEGDRLLFRIRERLALTLSTSAISDSISTIRDRSKPPEFTADGQRAWGENVELMLLDLGGVGKFYRDSLAGRGGWRPWWVEPQEHMFCLSSPATGYSTLDTFRFLVRKAYAGETELFLYVTPLNAAIQTMMVDFGLEPRYRFWQREMIRIIDEEAARAGKPPFTLWDFGGVNSITAEPIPASGDPAPMRYFWETSHFRQVVGDMILDRMFGRTATGGTAHDDFGVRLTAANIDLVQDRQTAERTRWAEANPELAASIRDGHPKGPYHQSEATCW